MRNMYVNLYARIQVFSSGGGPGQSDKISSGNVFFFYYYYYYFVFSPQLILQNSNGQFQRNLSFFHFLRFQMGSNIFQGEDPTFPRGGGGVQLLIPYRNPYNL